MNKKIFSLLQDKNISQVATPFTNPNKDHSGKCDFENYNKKSFIITSLITL